jgi:hypothetical protein
MFQAAPDVVAADQRREAERVFMTFHKTVAPYALCKHILGQYDSVIAINCYSLL